MPIFAADPYYFYNRHSHRDNLERNILMLNDVCAFLAKEAYHSESQTKYDDYIHALNHLDRLVITLIEKENFSA